MNWKNEQIVSIVVLTYQSSKFILEALESIKNQTWNNIELIISDDASTDNTVELCYTFIAINKGRFINTKIITSKENTGIPSNYNRGIKAASGDWIKFLDADDVLLHNCIMDNIKYIEPYPNVQFVVSDLIEIDEESNLVRENAIHKGMQYMINKTTSEEQLRAYARFPFFINSPSFFVKKSLLQNIDYCDEEFRIYEDITMTARVLIKGIKIDYLKVPTVKYRIHSSSISRTDASIALRNKEEYLIFKKYRSAHLKKSNPIDLSVYYEVWLLYKYKGIYGRKGRVILERLSLYYWYLRLRGVHKR